MKEKITPHIKSLLHHKDIASQYAAQEPVGPGYSDPLMEDSHEVVKGLVHKYDNRALIKVSYQCAAHCRFCTRIRQIGDPAGTLTDVDIHNIVQYIKSNEQIDDVILSGGDPLYTPHITTRLLQELRAIPSVKILRIGSRLALQSPISFKTASIRNLLELVNNIAKTKPFFLLLHINSPKELTDEVMEVIGYLRTLPVTLLSQTVFLKGINDNFETLYELFKKAYHAGIIPYYLYHCDAVTGLEHFCVDIHAEREIVKQLHQSLSGIGCPKFVIDVADGYGKIPVPLDFINLAENIIYDYNAGLKILK